MALKVMAETTRMDQARYGAQKQAVGAGESDWDSLFLAHDRHYGTRMVGENVPQVAAYRTSWLKMVCIATV